MRCSNKCDHWEDSPRINRKKRSKIAVNALPQIIPVQLIRPLNHNPQTEAAGSQTVREQYCQWREFTLASRATFYRSRGPPPTRGEYARLHIQSARRRAYARNLSRVVNGPRTSSLSYGHLPAVRSSLPRTSSVRPHRRTVTQASLQKLFPTFIWRKRGRRTKEGQLT